MVVTWGRSYLFLGAELPVYRTTIPPGWGEHHCWLHSIGTVTAPSQRAGILAGVGCGLEIEGLAMENLLPERLPGHPHQVTAATNQGEPGANKPAVTKRRVALVSVWTEGKGVGAWVCGEGRGQAAPTEVGTWGP